VDPLRSLQANRQAPLQGGNHCGFAYAAKLSWYGRDKGLVFMVRAQDSHVFSGRTNLLEPGLYEGSPAIKVGAVTASVPRSKGGKSTENGSSTDE